MRSLKYELKSISAKAQRTFLLVFFNALAIVVVAAFGLSVLSWLIQF